MLKLRFTTKQYGICPRCPEDKDGNDGFVDKVALNSERITLACRSAVADRCDFLMWGWDEKKQTGISYKVLWRGRKDLGSGR